MGGVPPLGYRGEGRTLAIVEEHAALIRRIFALYLELGTVRLLDWHLQREGLKAPRRTLGKGMIVGGIYLSRGQLYDILSNRIYLGEIVHRDQVYPGLHEAIIDRDVFDAVQAKMTANAHGNRTRPHAARPSLLAGKVVDGAGAPLVAHHTTNGTTRYRYYVSRDLQHGLIKRGYRLPASLVEQPVAERIATALADPIGLLVGARLETSDHQHLHERAADICARPRGERTSLLLDIVDQVQVSDTGFVIRCSRQRLATLLLIRAPDDAEPWELTVEASLQRGRSMRLVTANGVALGPAKESSVPKLIAQAWAWWGELRKGKLNVVELAAREGISGSYLTRIVRLAFMSPTLIDAALKGELRSGVDATALRLRIDLSARWCDQAENLMPK